MLRTVHQVSLLAGVASVVLGALPAWAADADEAQQTEAAKALETNVLTEVVVTTARRRQEAVQETPVAISSLGAEVLERSQASDIQDISKLVPNLQMTVIGGGGTSQDLALYLRGFGTGQVDPGQDPAVPVVIDGIAQPFVNGSNIDLFSIDRIEVLRGPQGTLFGKNSPTGVVNVTTRRPSADEVGAKAQIDYGRFNRIEARALINLPIIKDVLAINISGLKKNMDNWTYNIITQTYGAGGTNTGGVRLGALFTPNDRLNWYVTSEYYDDHSPPVAERSGANNVQHPPLELGQSVCLVAGICTPNPPLSQHFVYASPVDASVPNRLNKASVTSNLDFKFDPVTLTSVTGYQQSVFSNVDDASRTGTNYLTPHQGYHAGHFSQELRLASNKGGAFSLDDRLDWVLGAYYDRTHFHYQIYTFLFQGFLDKVFGAPPGTIPSSYGLENPAAESQVATSHAVFGHVIGKITDAWNLSFGVRQTWDEKDHSAAVGDLSVGPFNPNPVLPAPLTLDPKWNKLTFEAGTQYKLSPDQMAYFRFAQGYRAGGVQGTVTTPSPLYSLVYNPETVNTYEVGMKADWLNKRLRTNLTLFDSKYSNLQRDLSFFTPAVVQAVANAASATVKGVELEAIAVPIDPLTLHLTGGYLSTKYNSYNGNLANGVIPPGFTYDQSINLHQLFPFAPKWTIDAGFDYSVDWGAHGVTVLSADYDWRSSYSEFDVSIPSSIQSAYGLANASLRWEDPSGKYAVTAYGHNIFNKYYKSYAVPALGNIFSEGMPATWGIELSAKL